MAFRTWNRFIPYFPYQYIQLIAKKSSTDLVRTSVLIVGAVIIHQADEFKVVPHTALKVIRVVSRGDLDSTSTEFHVDSNGICDDGNPSAVERVNSELAVEMSVSRVIRMHSNGGITKHSFRTGGSDDDTFVGVLDGVSERSDDTEFETLLGIVALDIEQGSAGKMKLVNLIQIVNYKRSKL